MTQTACIVLAAGKGTRMKSDQPKVMHKVAGRSLLGHVLSAANDTGAVRHCVVCGPDMDDVAAEARRFAPDAAIAVQTDRLGTGHAVKMAKEALGDFDGTILILYGDVPLTKPETLKELADMVDQDMPLAVLGFEAVDPHGYGRMITGADGTLVAIREELDANETERKITLCNSGIMAVTAQNLWGLLDRLSNDNANGEYYLTDIVGLNVADGQKAGISVCDEVEVGGVNDRGQLAGKEAVLQHRKRLEVTANGATLVAPETVFFSIDTIIGRDVVIEPFVVFGTGVEISDDVTIESFCRLSNVLIDKGSVVAAGQIIDGCDRPSENKNSSRS